MPDTPYSTLLDVFSGLDHSKKWARHARARAKPHAPAEPPCAADLLLSFPCGNLCTLSAGGGGRGDGGMGGGLGALGGGEGEGGGAGGLGGGWGGGLTGVTLPLCTHFDPLPKDVGVGPPSHTGEQGRESRTGCEG
jgi:hypothetical protein